MYILYRVLIKFNQSIYKVYWAFIAYIVYKVYIAFQVYIGFIVSWYVDCILCIQYTKLYIVQSIRYILCRIYYSLFSSICYTFQLTIIVNNKVGVWLSGNPWRGPKVEIISPHCETTC